MSPMFDHRAQCLALLGAQVILPVFRVDHQHRDLCGADEMVVDDARATARSMSFRRHANLAQARRSLDQITSIRGATQTALQGGVSGVVQQGQNLAREGRRFDEKYALTLRQRRMARKSTAGKAASFASRVALTSLDPRPRLRGGRLCAGMTKRWRG